MRIAPRLALSSALVVAALLIAGCSASSGEQPPGDQPGAQDPTSSADPGDPGAGDTPAEDEIEAAWLDDGRMFAIVTWGSSTCVPMVDEVSADGQKVAVSLVNATAAEGEEKACTSDLTARASIGATPADVDPTREVEFTVANGDLVDDVDLDGNAALTGTPGESTSTEPSAGWFDDDGIVLLTWGSSTCPPIVDDIERTDAGATVTFATEDGVCTMDLAPRATILGVGDHDDDEGDFVLKLVGGGLDGTVEVLQG